MDNKTVDLGDFDRPLLVFGGPYSNLAATQAMLDQAERLNIPRQRLICTGDVVAYCAEAEQTCQLLRDSGVAVVMGNCEESLAEDLADCGCGFEPGMMCSSLAEEWYGYARKQISTTTRQWMAELPRALSFRLNSVRFRVIHGGVSQINQFIFASTDDVIKHQQLALADVDAIIGGHCGLPFGQNWGRLAWLNTGVIGLPANDGTQSGWYMQLTPQELAIDVSWHRLEYDATRSYQSMQQAGLQAYAGTLLTGLWPSMDVLPENERALQGKPLHPANLHITSA